jgi:hypothetical protein
MHANILFMFPPYSMNHLINWQTESRRKQTHVFDDIYKDLAGKLQES